MKETCHNNQSRGVVSLLFFLLLYFICADGQHLYAPSAPPSSSYQPPPLSEEVGGWTRLDEAMDCLYGNHGRPINIKCALDIFKEISLASPPTPDTAVALHELGEIYLRGVQGIPQDVSLAMDYFNQAISLGDLPSMHSMAFLLSTGFGGQPKDAERAMELEEKAALSGFIPSNMALGYHYIDTDCERALLFYKELADYAVEGEEALMEPPLGLQDLFGHKPPQDTADTLNRLEEQVKKGDVQAMYELGKVMDTGALGVTPDPYKAAELYNKAGESGHAAALTDLGMMYAVGAAGIQDYDAAVDLLEKAVELGEPKAQTTLGYMYRNGIAVDVDHNKGEELFLAAAAQDHPEALYYIGEDYYAAGDYVTALAYFQTSSDLGYLPAAYREGQLFEVGVDEHTIPRSCWRAVDAFKLVAEGGPWVADIRVGFGKANGAPQEAVVQTALAAYEGYSIAQCNAGYLMEKRQGYNYDDADEQAIAFYEAAEAQGETSILYDLGSLLSKRGAQRPGQCLEGNQCSGDSGGAEGDSDMVRGLSLLEAAAESGDMRAMERLAQLYEQGGNGVLKEGAARGRAEELYRALISHHKLHNDKNTLDFLATQSMLHVKLATLTLKDRVLGTLWQQKDSGVQDEGDPSLRMDHSLAFSSNLFLIADETDGRCVTSAATLGNCDENALWTAIGSQLISFLHPHPSTMCLSRVADPQSMAVVVESCSLTGARDWLVGLEGKKVSHNEECLVRVGNNLQVQPCFRGHTPLAAIDVSTHGRQGFLLKTKDGRCFDGEKFDSCRSPMATWGVVINDIAGGGQYSFYRTKGGFSGGRKQCLQKQRVVGEMQMVGVGACTVRGARRWNLKGGKLTEDQGRTCLGRRDLDGAPVLVPLNKGGCEELALVFSIV